MKRWIILVHRYLGIPMSVIFVVWFISGIVMMYTGDMPSLSRDDRLHGLGSVDLAALTLSPAEASAAAGIEGPVVQVGLQNLLGRPAYRFRRVFGRQMTVFADDGEVLNGASLEVAREEVARFAGQPLGAVHFVETISRADQWTITVVRELPLERFDIDDGRGTRAYFSLASGEIELVTDSRSRALAWLGAIPHWFYFTALRTNQPLWYWTVVWVSVLGCLLAALGLILAITQFRRSKPFRLAASIRYRGWMRWHYYSGALFGLLALTWVFSGLMSMEPFEWTRRSGMDLPPNDLEGGPLDLGDFTIAAPATRRALSEFAAAEIDLTRIQGRPYYVLTVAEGERHLVDAATLLRRSAPFPAETIVTAIEATLADARIVDHQVLHDYDSYYYSQDGSAPLPALRIRFDDSAKTWYYFDLMTSRAVAANHRFSRIERWLFNGLHSLDFGFWYGRRPLWDIGMILLSLGALATSGIGMYLGFKRLAGR